MKINEERIRVEGRMPGAWKVISKRSGKYWFICSVHCRECLDKSTFPSSLGRKAL